MTVLTWPRAVASVLAAVILGAAQAVAGELPMPAGDPILVIEGDIANTNVEGAAQFDRAMLESIGMESFVTETPWFTGPSKFEGVPLAKLMEMVGAKGDELEAVALNDYRATVPIADFADHGVILALKRDGEYMPVRDKGPLFIVYPYDSDPALQNQQYFARSVWQVARMVVK